MFLAITALAQTEGRPTDSLTNSDVYTADRWYIGTSVSHLAHPYMAGPYFTVGYRPRFRTAFHLEGGNLHQWGLHRNLHIQSLDGLRLKTAIRWYDRSDAGLHKQQYWGPKIGWQLLDVTLSGDFRQANQAFQQRIDYRLLQHSIDLILERGAVMPMGKRIDLYASIGAGLRINIQQFGNIPPAAISGYNGTRAWRPFNSQDDYLLIIPVSLGLQVHW